MKEKTCCVTGHRDIPAEQIGHIKKSLVQEVDRAISDGFSCFISSFADGADLLFAEIVAKRITKNPALKLIAAIPYKKRLAHSMKKDLAEIAVGRIVLPCHLQKWDVPIKYVKVLGHK